MKTFKGLGVSHRYGVCPFCRAEIFVEIETGVACEVLDRSILSTAGSVLIPGPAHVHPEIASALAEPVEHTPAEPDLPAAPEGWSRGFDYNGYSEGC